MARELKVDVAIFGGGIAGLWLLDALRRGGWSAVLLERDALGAGQTVWSQGIIHGGAKYTLRGLGDSLANVTKVIADMPGLWRECLAGEREPDLSAVTVRQHHCHLWRTSGLGSWFGMAGARNVLKTPLEKLDKSARPAALAAVPGEVYQLDEQVISPVSLVSVLAGRNSGLLHSVRGLGNFEAREETADAVSIFWTSKDVRISARHVCLCAGGGNAALRSSFGLSAEVMQIRPLRMVLARGGNLPFLHGHCIDGAKTRVTITSDRDSGGRVVWQVGGDIAERGVSMDDVALAREAAKELHETVPGVDFSAVEFAFHDAPRAEERTERGFRPDDVSLLIDGRILTIWPTKLALAPRVAERVIEHLHRAGAAQHQAIGSLPLPQPGIALPPWESATQWVRP